MIAHAWLHMFGTPEGMRVIPLEIPARIPQIGLVIADRDPESIPARALLELTRDLDIRCILDRVLHEHLRSTQRG